MSLRKKTLLIVGMTFALLIAILVITANILVVGEFVDLEAEDVRVNVERGINEISNLMSHLGSIAGDWATWDDTYTFIQKKNPGYIADNLTGSAIVNLGVDFMLFFDDSDRLFHGAFFDLSTGEEIPAPDGLLEEIAPSDSLFMHNDANSRKTGVIVVNGTPILLASRPILKSDYTGPIGGALIVGKRLDSMELKRLSENLQLSLDVQIITNGAITSDDRKARALFSTGDSISVEPGGRDVISGRASFTNIRGNPAFLLKITMPRKIYGQGLKTFYYYTFSMIFIGLFFIFLIMLFLEKTVLSPLSRLSAEVHRIGDSGEFNVTIPVSGKDELGVLSNEINIMLRHIGEKSIELSEINHDLRREIDERKKAEITISKNETRLREQNGAIVELSRINMRELDDSTSALKRITEKVAAILEVERISVWRYIDNRTKLTCLDLYELGKRRHSDGMELSSEDHPDYFNALREDRQIAAHDARSDSRTREFSATHPAPPGITSMLDSPMGIGGRTAGVIRIEHVGPSRRWTIDEQTFSASIADLVSLSMEAFERKRAEEVRKKLEAQLQRAEKMEAIGALAGGVAHDLNNILSGLVSYPDLLLLEIPPESKLRKPLSTIKKSGEKASAIVQDLLTLTRRGVAETEVVDLNGIISDCLRGPEHGKILLNHPETRVETDLDPDLSTIVGSPVHLSKTVMNLISNAAEAMPLGGVIHASTRNRYIETPIPGYDHIAEGDYVALSISDPGTGISPEDKKRIFEPFYTKKVMGNSGSGLGMAVVWGAVKDHNGYIDVQSVEGEGTTFTLYFPAARK